jgi:hypothetical protein
MGSGIATVDRGGRPLLAWLTTSSPAALYVHRWETDRWVSLGGALNVDALDAAAPALAFEPGGDPLVAWIEGGAAVHAARWDGTAWERLGGDLRAPAPAGTAPANPAVAAGGSARGSGAVVAVSWSELGGTSGVVVKRYAR